MSFLAKVEAWEEAWSEYVSALERYEDWDLSGPEFVVDIGRAGAALAEAKRVLRGLDPEFCKLVAV